MVVFSTGVKIKMADTIPKKTARPPALGTVRFWVWAGCGLSLGLSISLNFFAKMIVKGIARMVTTNEMMAGSIRDIVKQKSWFFKQK